MTIFYILLREKTDWGSLIKSDLSIPWMNMNPKGSYRFGSAEQALNNALSLNEMDEGKLLQFDRR